MFDELEETLMKNLVDVDIYHLEESTIIYECVEQYVDALNTDQRLRPGISENEKYLDQALFCFENNPNHSKELIDTFLSNIIKPNPTQKRRIISKPKEKKLSNRKRKRKVYSDFQRLSKKKRKSAFANLYSNNSIDNSLQHDQVFDFWSHLLCKKSVKFVDHPIQPKNNNIHFDPNLLVYPREIKGCQGKKPSAAGPDGLSVRDEKLI